MSLQARWDALAVREQALLLAAALLVGAALLWWIALAPALQTLRGAPARHAALDGELARMQALAQRAQVLQAQPKLGYDDAVRALEASVRARLGPGALLSIAGERATITLKGISSEALAAWLAQARVNARALPVEARLQRAVAAAPAWDGTLQVSLPPR